MTVKGWRDYLDSYYTSLVEEREKEGFEFEYVENGTNMHEIRVTKGGSPVGVARRTFLSAAVGTADLLCMTYCETKEEITEII